MNALKKLWEFWKAFAHVLGVVNTALLLALTYLLLIGPVGLVLQLTGRDLLRKSAFRRGPAWVPKADEQGGVENYTHPF